MTRRAGTVPVRLARHRAVALAKWIATFRPLEPGLLDTAGISDWKVEEDRNAECQALHELHSALAGQSVGRRRGAVSAYHLPVAGIRLLDSGYAAMQLPRRLRPVVSALLKATRRRKGPKLSRFDRRRNIANGNYAAETVRRYRWQERKRIAAEQHRQSLKPTAEEIEQAMAEMPRPGSPEFAMLAMLAARRWLV